MNIKKTLTNLSLATILVISILAFTNETNTNRSNIVFNEQVKAIDIVEENLPPVKELDLSNTNILSEQISLRGLESENIEMPRADEPQKRFLSDVKVVKKQPTEIPKIEGGTIPTQQVAQIRPNTSQNTDKYKNTLVIGLNHGLTDTLMVVNINETRRKITTIGIPRDFWDKNFKEKINRIYIRHGLHSLLDSVESLVDLKIDNYVILDFQGFKSIVDHFGGIWIYNSKYILDKRYPSDDYQYETFELAEGYHKLDGNTALKFARTRHGDSDFMRSRRQQEVINGVYNAFKNLKITDINAVLNISRELIVNIKTDYNVFDILSYLTDYKDYEIITGNIIESPTHLYSDRNYYGEFILLPRDPSLMHIHNYVSKLIK